MREPNGEPRVAETRHLQTASRYWRGVSAQFRTYQAPSSTQAGLVRIEGVRGSNPLSSTLNLLVSRSFRLLSTACAYSGSHGVTLDL